MVVIMFGNMLYIINAPGKGDGLEQGNIDLLAGPFQSPGMSMLSVFMMMFGQFEPIWFQTESSRLTGISIGLFVCFMFVPPTSFAFTPASFLCLIIVKVFRGHHFAECAHCSGIGFVFLR
jgi:hypothetical protein